MQLKQFYNIATKVSSRKSATTFGDLPDCSGLYIEASMQDCRNIWLMVIKSG